jgi:hypothetical protein
MRSQFEREGPAHIDMSMGDRRDLTEELVRKQELSVEERPGLLG